MREVCAHPVPVDHTSCRVRPSNAPAELSASVTVSPPTSNVPAVTHATLPPRPPRRTRRLCYRLAIAGRPPPHRTCPPTEPCRPPATTQRLRYRLATGIEPRHPSAEVAASATASPSAS